MHPTYLKLKSFLEDREVCHKASAPMKPEAQVRILFADHDESYTFRRLPNGPRIEPGDPQMPDFMMRLPKQLVDDLCSMQTEDIGEFGVFLFRNGLSDDPNYRIEGAIYEGFWTLWRRGYFGILRLGGWQLIKYLASRGITSIGIVRKKINDSVRAR